MFGQNFVSIYIREIIKCDLDLENCKKLAVFGTCK